MGEVTVKTWAQIAEEAYQLAKEKGWQDPPPTFKTAMALVHSEISEALEAWRQWGMRDATHNVPHFNEETRMPGSISKPEGVPSEFADILIRMAHYAHLFSIDVPEKSWSGPVYDIHDDQEFLDDLDDMHNMISMVSEWRVSGLEFSAPFASAVIFLRHLSAWWGIDLPTEYERKMAYNATRPHRHGGKRA